MTAASVAIAMGIGASGCGNDGGGTAKSENGSREVVETFVEVGAEAGLDFLHHNGMSGERYMVEMMGPGGAWLDYDNDGDVDLYLANFGPNRMYRNDGDGSFSDVTAAAGTDDGRWSVPCAFLDYDRDGRLDLYVGNYVAHRIASNKRCYADAGYLDYCGPKAYDSEPDRLFRNRGDGTFEDVTRRAGLGSSYGAALGAIPADFDGDGWIDLYVANDGAANQLWLNRGDGTFDDEALLGGCAVNRDGAPEASMGVDAADFDNDGDEDLFMSHLSKETNTVYINDGSGVFEDATVATGLGTPSFGYTGFGAGWLDFDNDGWLDVLVVNGAVVLIDELVQLDDPYPLHQRNQLFRNTSRGGFEDVSDVSGKPFERSEVSRGAAFGDVDNDGDTDVLVVNNNGPARLLLNTVGQHRHWIGLDLLTADGRAALGAWVGAFTPDGASRWRRVRVAGSYGSANDPRVLIGLGDAGHVERVEIRWPDGSSEVRTDVGVDAYTTVRQGTAP